MTTRDRPLPGTTRDEAFGDWTAGLVLPVPRPVALDEAAGCVLAVPIAARLSVPARDEAACAGLAARSEDLAAVPVRLLPAPKASVRLAVGHVHEVDPGDPLPDGADVVVPRPFVVREGHEWLARVAPARGSFVRQAGEERVAGDAMFPAGTCLSAEDLAQLARAGWCEVMVLPRPRVATLLVTDREVDPSACDGAGRAPEDRGPWLHAMLAECGHPPLRLGWARPDDADLPDRVEAAMGLADLLMIPARHPEAVARRLQPSLGAGMRVLDLPGESGPSWVVRQARRLVLVTPLDPWGLAAALDLLALPVLRRLAGFEDRVLRRSTDPDRPAPEPLWWPCRLEEALPQPLDRGEPPIVGAWLHPDGTRHLVSG